MYPENNDGKKVKPTMVVNINYYIYITSDKIHKYCIHTFMLLMLGAFSVCVVCTWARLISFHAWVLCARAYVVPSYCVSS